MVSLIVKRTKKPNAIDSKKSSKKQKTTSLRTKLMRNGSRVELLPTSI